MEQEITYKKCSKCGEEKPLTKQYWYKDTRTKTTFTYRCKTCLKQDHKLKYEKNREDSLKKNKKWRMNNRDKINNREKERLKSDSLYKTKSSVRCLIRDCIRRKGWGKRTKTNDYLKCDWETFKEHIESQFIEGMSWDNHGEWHYDHYYPISLAQTEEDMYIFNHYTNFQPLWESDNKSKKDKVPDGFEEWYKMMKEKVSQ